MIFQRKFNMFISISKVCLILGVSLSTVYRMLKHGQSWYASVSYEIEIPDPVVDEERAKTRIGIDMGIKEFAVMVDHNDFSFHEEGPKALKTHLTKLRRKSRNLSKKVKGSKNWEKGSTIHTPSQCFRGRFRSATLG